MIARSAPHMLSTNHDRFTTVLRTSTVLVLLASAVFYIAVSLHWRIAVDTPVMHYVVFLMRHGMKPYSDISDNNMPGAYLTEAAAMRVFGPGDMAWRIYEYFLLAVLTGSMVVIARRWDWIAGIFGGGMFLVIHSAEGPQLAVERELVIGVLLLVSYAALFLAVRHHRPPLLALFGLACGVAASIKPTYIPLPLGILLLACLALRREKRSWWPYALWAFAGLVTILLVDVVFLVHYSALPGFLFILRKVLPAYAASGHGSMWLLLKSTMPRAVFVLVLTTIPLISANRRRFGSWSWEHWALAAGAGFGLLSLFAQGKGYVYHRYVFLMFLLLLLGLEILPALRLRGWPRAVAALSLTLALLYVVPGHLNAARQITGRSDLELGMEHDLQLLGGTSALQGKVECLDLVYGCLNALYHLDLVENTGFTGDLLFFPKRETDVVRFYRERFWTLARQDPADVLIVSNGIFAEENNFNKLERWPAFADYLRTHYTEIVERNFPLERYGVHYATPLPPGDSYRLYVRNGSASLARASALAAPSTLSP